jgi:phage/plasmid primase-like uncharacterized protein
MLNINFKIPLIKCKELGLTLTHDQLQAAIDQPDTLYRCGTIDHPTSDNGAYKVKLDSKTQVATCCFWNHETKQKKFIPVSFRDKNAPPLTAQERHKLSAHIEQNKTAAIIAQDKESRAKAHASTLAFSKFSMLKDPHPYLTRKGNQNYGFRITPVDAANFHAGGRYNPATERALAIPFFNSEGTQQGYQTIGEEGSKRLHGAPSGCFWSYPQKGNFYILGEGLATVLSAYEAIKLARPELNPIALVAFNAGNLCKVVQATEHKKLPYLLLVDNDGTTNSNTGINTALDLLGDCNSPITLWISPDRFVNTLNLTSFEDISIS